MFRLYISLGVSIAFDVSRVGVSMLGLLVLLLRFGINGLVSCFGIVCLIS